MNKFILPLLLLSSALAHADIMLPAKNSEKYSPLSIEAIEQMLASYVNSLNERRSPVTLTDAIKSSVRDSSATAKSCQNLNQSIFTRDITDMRIFFGYKSYTGKDGKTYTQDIHIKLALLDSLTRPCPERKTNINFNACGFEYAPIAKNNQFVRQGNTVSRYDSIVQKSFKDALGNNRTLRIAMVHSSLWLNKQITDPRRMPIIGIENPGMNFRNMSDEQRTRSDQVAIQYTKALQTADIVYYNGPSRRNGAPDFYPPVTTSSGAVDYDWYAKRGDLDLKRLLQTLSTADQKVKLAGFFSPSSESLLWNKIKSVTPTTNLLFNGDVTSEASLWIDEPISIFGSINALIGGFCVNSFNGSMRFTGMDTNNFATLRPIVSLPNTSTVVNEIPASSATASSNRQWWQ
jgi:hypothetical protein